MPCVRSGGREHLPPGRPATSRLPRLSRSGDPGPGAPWRVAIYAATSKPSCNSSSQHPLKAHGARTVLLAGDPPDRPEPERQGLAGILKDRPCRHRTLVAAARTLQQNVGYWPTLSPSTARATESLGPAEPKQILRQAASSRTEPRIPVDPVGNPPSEAILQVGAT